MQLTDLNSKPHGGQTLIDLIDRAIRTHFYTPSESSHRILLRLYQFHNSTNLQKHLKPYDA